MSDLTRAPISERYDHLLGVISSERFLRKEGLGNEIPFFICPFPPEDAIEMADIGKQLLKKLANQGIRALKINLYDLAIELLQERSIWEDVLEKEASLTKDELRELLQSVLDPERHVVPAIAERMSREEFDVLFLTGVGEVFPYIRSHTILNNLQSVAKEKPTVMFFPGEYRHTTEDGTSLELFGLLRDDKYYRAFNIYHYQI